MYVQELCGYHACVAGGPSVIDDAIVISNRKSNGVLEAPMLTPT